MEKILEKSHEWQTIINKKMKEGFVLDAKAKQTFSQGILIMQAAQRLCYSLEVLVLPVKSTRYQ